MLFFLNIISGRLNCYIVYILFFKGGFGIISYYIDFFLVLLLILILRTLLYGFFFIAIIFIIIIFIFIIIFFYDKLVNFYVLWWLLYQRIFNTFWSLPYPCSKLYVIQQWRIQRGFQVLVNVGANKDVIRVIIISCRVCCRRRRP